MNTNKKTRTLAMIGMLSAVALVLMLFDFPLPFLPSFYKIDLSELPVLVGAFAFGPLAGVLIEALKILLHLLFRGTQTAMVGELANFFIGISFVLPAAFLYRRKKTRTRAILGMTLGTICTILVGCVLNAYVLLPAYAKAFQMPIDALVSMGTAVNGSIHSLFTFVVLAVAPFNLIKCFVVALITMLIYKQISHLLKGE